MFAQTVPAADGRFDLPGALAVLQSLQASHGDEQLDADTAQMTLRAVHETMLSGWIDAAPETDLRVMFGVALARLAEQSCWADVSRDGDAPPSAHTLACIEHARRFLQAVADAREAEGPAETVESDASAPADPEAGAQTNGDAESFTRADLSALTHELRDVDLLLQRVAECDELAEAARFAAMARAKVATVTESLT